MFAKVLFETFIKIPSSFGYICKRVRAIRSHDSVRWLQKHVPFPTEIVKYSILPDFLVTILIIDFQSCNSRKDLFDFPLRSYLSGLYIFLILLQPIRTHVATFCIFMSMVTPSCGLAMRFVHSQQPHSPQFRERQSLIFPPGLKTSRARLR